jgi:Kinesin motor domain
MQGDDEDPGILPISLKDIFRQIEMKKETMKFFVWISYLEIYEEKLKDLLDNAVKKLDIMNDDKVKIFLFSCICSQKLKFINLKI